MKKKKNVFIEGPIAPIFIAESIAKHQHKTDVGAHDIFLGQVRKDAHGDQFVKAIEYSCYAEMAEKVIDEIRAEGFDKFNISCMHIYHSTGVVPVGQIGFFVFASSPHRQDAFDCVRYVVDEIKERAPIFGKEILTDDTVVVKQNKA